MLAFLPASTSFIQPSSLLGTHASASPCKTVLLSLIDEPDEVSPLSVGLQLLPVTVSAATDEPAFALAYAPLAVIGYVSGANPAAPLVLSTLLYGAAASLSDNSHALLPLSCLLNIGVAAALLSLEDPARLLGENEEPVVEDELTAFDRRLESAVREKKSSQGRAKRWRWWGSKSDDS